MRCVLPWLLPGVSQIEAPCLPKKQHAGQGWVAICSNWLELAAVGGAAGTPPGLTPAYSGNATSSVCASEGGLVSQVRPARG